jgi:hypothetical protein
MAVPTPQLSKTAQVGFKAESTLGTAETLAAADFAGVHKDLQAGRSIARYAREAARSTLSMLPALPGSRMGTIGFAMECIGGGAATPAKWHEALQACGYQAEVIKSASYTSPTNADELFVGQTLGNNATESSATKTAILVHIDTANSKIYYLPVTASEFADTDTVYNYTSTQFDCTISSTPAAAGYSHRPLTPNGANQHEALTVEEIRGGYVTRLVGARGSATVRIAMDEPMLIQGSFQGPLDAPVSGASEAKAFVADIPTPPNTLVVKGSALRFREGTAAAHTPVMTELTIDLGNTVSDRKTMADNDIEGSGYLPASITDRAPTASIDPEANISGFDIVQNVIDASQFQITASIGSLTDTNGLIKVWAPNAQFDGDLEDTDRDGHQSYSPNTMLTGDNDNELYFFHVFA